MLVASDSASFQIPLWISSKVYSLQKETFAYIINHKSNELIELDGVSAVLWQKILENDLNIKDFVKKNNLENEFNDFINELCSLELLLTDNKIESALNNTSQKDTLPIYTNDCDFLGEITEFLGNNGFLPRLFLELTYNCNLRCIHCFNEKNIESKSISFDDAKKIIDEAISLGTFSVTVSGGECTLNNDFVKIAEYVRKNKLALEIFTNGQTLYDNVDLLNKILKLYPYKVSLSLYSMRPEIHDKITKVSGSHKKTIEVIKKLKENNINVEIKCFLTKYNAYDYLEVQNFAEDNQINMTLDYELIPNNDGTNENIRITEKQLLDLLIDESSIHNIKHKNVNNINGNFKKFIICGIARNSLSVNPNLDIYCCPPLKIKLGNYRETTLHDVWDNNRLDSKKNKLKNLRKSDIIGCYEHDFCKYCVYCPGIAYSENSFLKPCENFCRQAKIKMQAVKICGIEQ